jgi:hypothetical protein
MSPELKQYIIDNMPEYEVSFIIRQPRPEIGITGGERVVVRINSGERYDIEPLYDGRSVGNPIVDKVYKLLKDFNDSI